jgi:hypothetical protein
VVAFALGAGFRFGAAEVVVEVWVTVGDGVFVPAVCAFGTQAATAMVRAGVSNNFNIESPF